MSEYYYHVRKEPSSIGTGGRQNTVDAENQNLQLIRRYGLYAFRTKGRWKDMLWVSERAPEGWKRSLPDAFATEGKRCAPFSEDEVETDVLACKHARARLLAKYHRCILPGSQLLK